MAKLLRKKTKVLIAFGSCAYMGGIPSLANLSDSKQILERVFVMSPSTVNPSRVYPQIETRFQNFEMSLPKLSDAVMSLDQVVEVDCYLPGCPPPVKLIQEMIEKLVNNNLPEKGSVLAPTKSVCDECKRTRHKKILTRLKE
ncbi:MAG: hypothetical protein ACUVV4_01985 [Candidatus Bathyarchaeia archaeon]